VNEDKVERALDWIADVLEVVGIGGCLAFAAYVFTTAGVGAAAMAVNIMLVPYFIGRHQAAKSFVRLLPAVKAKWERDRSEEP
jgi:hypothetical protein